MKLNTLLKTAVFAAAAALSLPQTAAAWTPEEPILLRIGFGAERRDGHHGPRAGRHH